MPDNTVHEVGIILNGVTGRMGTNQHLMRYSADHPARRCGNRPVPTKGLTVRGKWLILKGWH